MLLLACFLLILCVGVALAGETSPANDGALTTTTDKTVKQLPGLNAHTRLNCARAAVAFNEFKYEPPVPRPIGGKIPIDRADVIDYLAYGNLKQTLITCRADACGAYDAEYPAPSFRVIYHPEFDVCEVKECA